MKVPTAGASATVAGAVQHFIFGYGSLISSHSRAATVATAVKQAAAQVGVTTTTPVVVQGWQGVWAKRSSRSCMTAMGVRPARPRTTTSEQQQAGGCIGVLLPVTETELGHLDRRELGYRRTPLHLRQVDTVPFLNREKDYAEPDHAVFLQAKQQQQQQQEEEAFELKSSSSDDDVNFLSSSSTSVEESDEKGAGDVSLWVYVPEKPMAPTIEYPIVQTYLDTILRGCLEINEEFAAEFLTTTAGWHSAFSTSSSTGGGDDNDPISATDDPPRIFLVDDRHAPIYRHGDPEWSRRHADFLDGFIQKHRPDLLDQRQTHRKWEKIRNRKKHDADDAPSLRLEQ